MLNTQLGNSEVYLDLNPIGYALTIDFPPRYRKWVDDIRQRATWPAVIYARVVEDGDDVVAQYWFFYVFNGPGNQGLGNRHGGIGRRSNSFSAMRVLRTCWRSGIDHAWWPSRRTDPASRLTTG